MMLRTGNKPMGGILSLRESSSSLIVIIASKFSNSISFCLQVPLQFYMNKANSKQKSSEMFSDINFYALDISYCFWQIIQSFRGCYMYSKRDKNNQFSGLHTFN